MIAGLVSPWLLGRLVHVLDHSRPFAARTRNGAARHAVLPRLPPEPRRQANADDLSRPPATRGGPWWILTPCHGKAASGTSPLRGSSWYELPRWI